MTHAQRTPARPTTTIERPRDPSPGPARPHHVKPSIKPVEVTGGALAAVTSAVIASSFGFSGTLIGVAVGSVLSSVGAALYGSWLRRAGGRIAVTRTLVVRTVAGGRATPDDPAALPPELAAGLATTPAVEVPAVTPKGGMPGRIRWKPVAALAALTFVLGLTTLTVAETILGRPAAGGSGTTVGRLLADPAPDIRRPERPTSTAPGATTAGASPTATTDGTTEPTSTTAPSTSGTTGSTRSETVTGSPAESAEPSPSAEPSAPPGSGGAEPTPSGSAPADQSP